MRRAHRPRECGRRGLSRPQAQSLAAVGGGRPVVPLQLEQVAQGLPGHLAVVPDQNRRERLHAPSSGNSGSPVCGGTPSAALCLPARSPYRRGVAKPPFDRASGDETAAAPTLLDRILAAVPPTFTDSQAASALCEVAVAHFGGSCEVVRRDVSAVLTRLARIPVADDDEAPVLPDRLARLLADSDATAEPVRLVEPPWNGRAVAVPLVGLAGMRWLLVLDSIAEPSVAMPAQLHQLAWAARHVLSFGGAVEQLGRSRRAADAATHRLIALSRLSELLPTSLGLEPTVAAVLDAVVPYVGDWAAMFLARPGRGLERVGTRHTSVEGGRWLAELDWFPLPADPVRRQGWLAGAEPFRVGYGGTGDAAAFPAPAGAEELVRRLAPLSCVVAPMCREDELVGVLAVGTSESGQRFERDELRLVRDLAKQARLAIQAAQLYAGAEQARREREEVLAIVSHDLRNPLQTVRLAGTVLGFPDLPQDKRAEQAAVMQRSLEAMDRLIQDLLDAARMEAGGFAVRARPVAVPGLLADAYRAFELIANDKQVALRLEPAVPESLVLADREAVLRVFGNLLGNAISFTPAGGRITLGAEPAPGGVAFRVCDSGPGIDAQVLPRIFDRYWQAKRTSRGGAGLGLAIAKGIVEAHGGTIGARTLPEGGSEFRFTLQAAADVDPSRSGGDQFP